MKLMTTIPMLASVGVLYGVVQTYTSVVPSFLQQFESLQAPTLTSRTLAEAEATARHLGLQVVVADRQPTDDSLRDVVISQTPRPDSRVRRGDVLKLTLSAGVHPPSVAGQTPEAARVHLLRAGWKAAPELEMRPADDAAPGVVIDQRPRSDELAPEKGIVTLIVAERNLAAGKRVQTSAGGTATEATDGQPQTVAWPVGTPPQWFEVDFGGPLTITEISLLAAAEQPGPAIIELWAWDASGRFFPVHLFTDDVSDNSRLTGRLAGPVTNVVRLRVATTAAPGPLGWREITVRDQ